jgi:carbonic anhydrase
LKHRDQVTLVALAHTRCGAVAATLSEPAARPDTEALPLVEGLAHRFADYRRVHPDPASTDPQLLIAAAHNAMSAAREIVAASGADGRFLHSMVALGRLSVVPARYRLKSGTVDFFEPVR